MTLVSLSTSSTAGEFSKRETLKTPRETLRTNKDFRINLPLHLKRPCGWADYRDTAEARQRFELRRCAGWNLKSLNFKHERTPLEMKIKQAAWLLLRDAKTESKAG